ncbi:MAG: hypothetical protein HY742_02410 [Deltaproteobacteria bacterium]|nr:hypothetical protein [Deltaproteobacteria bacterium]
MNQEDSHDSIEPGQDVEIDCFRSEDAEGVARLFRIVYGSGYPIQTFLEPEILRRENAAGRTISTVARTPKGDIVGHNALYQSTPHPRTYESGAGLVHPAYRGNKGMFTRLIAHGEETGCREFGIEGIFGEAVCNHLLSQKAASRQGWITQALEVDLMPASAYDKEKSATGRVSSLVDFKTLMPKPQRVCLPAVYEGAFRLLYGGLDDSRHMDFVENESLPDSATDIKTQFFAFAGVARIAVHAAGTEFAGSFDVQEQAVLKQGALVIQVWLPLAFPWISRLVGDLKERGYFLGGLLPRWFGGDGMLMQKILQRPNWEGIQLYSDRAGTILELVKADWARTVNVS